MKKKKSITYLILALVSFAVIIAVSVVYMGKSKSANASSSNSEALDVKITKPTIKSTSNIVYSQTFGMNNSSLKMDILQPSNEKELPAVIFITGGGFIGSPKDNYVQQRVTMAEAGYVVASIEYRVIPFDTFPAPLEDVKSAIRYLKANAKTLGIDPENIAVMGESAGGYLAALAGTTNGNNKFDKGDNLNQNSKIQAVIDLYGLSDLTKIGEDYSEEVQATHDSPASAEAMLINSIPLFGRGGSINNNPEAASAANPINYIEKDVPPFLIMHGEKDTTVSPSQTEILHQALVEKGMESTRYVVKEAGHGGEYWSEPEVINIIIDFLDKNLKNE